MKKIADISAYVFIMSVFLLSIISILGVWSVLEGDVVVKSFQSLGIITFAAIVVLVADQMFSSNEEKNTKVSSVSGQQIDPSTIQETDVQTDRSVEVFTLIKHSTIVTLITSSVMLALIGIMAIWEVLEKDVLYKSISTLLIIVFSSLLTIFICKAREVRHLVL